MEGTKFLCDSTNKVRCIDENFQSLNISCQTTKRHGQDEGRSEDGRKGRDISRQRDYTNELMETYSSLKCTALSNHNKISAAAAADEAMEELGTGHWRAINTSEVSVLCLAGTAGSSRQESSWTS